MLTRAYRRYRLGPGGAGTTPADQIQAGATIWSNYFSSRHYSFTIQVVSSASDANVIFQAGDLGPQQRAAGASQPGHSGAIASQTITINTTGQIRGTTLLLYDPSQNGYQTYFAKVALDELGHVLGLADVTNNCQASQSIMDQLCGVNDSGQGIPLAITSCDDQEEQTLEPPPTPDPCKGVNCHCATTGCCLPPCCSGSGAAPTPPPTSQVVPSGPLTFAFPARSVTPNNRCTPILLDLSGKGFRLTDTEQGVDFDFFGDGDKVRVPWTARGAANAWLVLDRNGDGTIDDASELFGNLTPQPPSDNPNGYVALAQYDRPENGGNNDGVIDERDRIYSSLRLWIDKNHNGASEKDELFTLKELGIEGLDLTYQQGRITDPNGNIFRLRGAVITGPGSKASSTDFDVILVNASKLE